MAKRTPKRQPSRYESAERKPRPKNRKAVPLKPGRFSKMANSPFWKRILPSKQEFRQDSLENSLLAKLYMTKLQRLHLLKWALLILLCIGLLTVQDVIMSRVTIFGATTDLIPCVILLITVMEGVDIGSIFVVVASMLYQFSGFSPGAFSVGIMSLLGIFATLFRQAYWHRNRNSILLCAGIAMVLYEMGVFTVGCLLELTSWYRFSTFLVTGVISWIVMIPLYPLIDRIGQIGGSTWTE